MKKILIVDDSATERLILEKMLKEAGYVVVYAINGDDAVLKSKEENPDLILMDVIMPGKNGYEATREILKKHETSEIPVILCTSKNNEVDKFWGMKQGAKDYVVKPIKKDVLIPKIKLILER